MRQAASRPRLLRQAEKHFLGLTPPQALVLSFVGLSLVGTLLLKLPIASHAPTSWMQALFTAVSASTISGLTVVATGSHFTLFGHWILILLMQCGGLGLMTFGILILRLSSGRLALHHRAALRETFNQSGSGDIFQLMRLLVLFVILMEASGTVVLALQWVPQMGLGRGLFHSFFHAVSAFNNAGFALAPDSLSRHVGNPLINLVISMLFISGGIGFAVIADLVSKKRFRDYALHTKLMLLGTVLINLVAMLVLFGLEYGNPDTLGALQGWSTKLWASWFQAVAPRSSGFATVDTAKLLPASAFFVMGLMFIGAGSGSTGGGIKLTTFIVLLLATRAFIRQHKHPVVFGRALDTAMTLKALAITIIALLCVITGAFLLTITESGNFLDLAFEAVSAATTTGLSRGITPSLSLPGQIIVMILMLIGRIGPLTLAFTLANPRGSRIQYPPGQVNIG
jgi:trk system potassium uptake protein TrkH